MSPSDPKPNSQLETLIEIYSAPDPEGSIAFLRKNDGPFHAHFKRSKLKLIQERPSFAAELDRVEDAKADIEAAQLTALDARDQVKKCLCERMLSYARSTSKREERMEIMRQLILNMFSSGWSKAQVKHFNTSVDRLKDWKCFFLSYTNKGAPSVNSRFKEVIEGHVEKETRERRLDENQNALVDAIVTCLHNHRVFYDRQFYDKKDLAIGDPLRPVIKAAATKAFAFVQLVHVNTLTEELDQNWCHVEYRFFRDNLTAGTDLGCRFKPILAGKKAIVEPDTDQPGIKYKVWRDDIFSDRLFGELRTDPNKFEKQMVGLRDAIVSSIMRMVGNVPPSPKKAH